MVKHYYEKAYKNKKENEDYEKNSSNDGKFDYGAFVDGMRNKWNRL